MIITAVSTISLCGITQHTYMHTSRAHCIQAMRYFNCIVAYAVAIDVVVCIDTSDYFIQRNVTSLDRSLDPVIFCMTHCFIIVEMQAVEHQVNKKLTRRWIALKCRLFVFCQAM